MDLGELLISVRINSSAALSSLKTMKQELNDTANKANAMQAAMDKTGKAVNNAGTNYTNLNNALAFSSSKFSTTANASAKVKEAYDEFNDIISTVIENQAMLASKNDIIQKGTLAAAMKTKEFGDASSKLSHNLRNITKEVAATSEAYTKQEKAISNVSKAQKDSQKTAMDTTAAYRTLAMYATVAFAGIVASVKKGTDAFNQYRSAMTGLKSIAQGTGNSFSAAQKFIEDYTKDGLIPAAEAATALKNLLSRGYTDTQASDVLYRLKDSAAFGRQASLGLGEAVRSASEGLKNENSILVDNAGVTRNVSKMWEDYSKQLGKSVNDLTQAEKIQAEYNGIMQETRHQVGDAAKLSGELAGTQAAVGKSVNELGVAFGESLTPALNVMLATLNSIIKFLANFVKEHKTVISVVTLFGAAMFGTIGILSGAAAAIGMVSSAIGILKGAMVGLGIAANLNPVILAITALTAVLATSITLWSNHKEAEAKAAKQMEETNKIIEKRQELLKKGITPEQISTYEKESKSLDDYIKKYEEYRKVIDETNASLSKYNQSQPANSDGIALYSTEESQKIKLWTTELDKAQKNLKELQKQASDDGIDLETEAKAKAQKEYNDALKESIKLAKALDVETAEDTAKNIASKQQSIQSTKNLIETYKTAKQGSDDWIESEKNLAELFPQFSTLNSIKIKAIENSIDATERQNKTEWNAFRDTITRNKQLLDIELKLSRYKLLSGTLTDEETKKVTDNVKTIISALETYKNYDVTDVADIPGATPVRKEPDTGKSSEKTAYEKAIELYEHRKNLGQLTLNDEVDVLKSIKSAHARSAEEIMDADERIYNARIALQDSILKLSEDELKYKDSNSQRWIAQKKRENDLTVKEEIEAYGRIKARHTEYLSKILADENITAEKKAEIHDRELNEIDNIEETIYGLRKDYLKQFEEDNKNTVDTLLSDWERYIKRQKLRNKMDGDQEINEYNGMIKQHKEYLAKIESDNTLAEDEKLNLMKETTRNIEDLEDKIYSVKKEYLDKYLDEYYNSLEDEMDAQEDAELEKLKLKKEAVEKYYEDIEKQSDKEDRSEKLAELRKKELLYQNAATKEGLETLADTRKEIADLEAEAEEERLESEKEAKLDALDAEIEDTEDKYETMRKNLQKLRTSMESETYKMAENIGINLSNAQSAIADRAVSIFNDADSSINSFLRSIQSNLRQIENVKSQLSTGQLSAISNIQESAMRITPSLSGIGNFVGTAIKESLNMFKEQQKKEVSVTFNDYGNKTLGDKDDYRDYAEELVEAAKSKSNI